MRRKVIKFVLALLIVVSWNKAGFCGVSQLPKPRVPQYPIAHSVMELHRQVRQYNDFLNRAQKEVELSDFYFGRQQYWENRAIKAVPTSHTPEQQLRRLKARMPLIKRLGHKAESFNPEEQRITSLFERHLASALGLFRAIRANPLYRKHCVRTATVFRNHQVDDRVVPEMGTERMRFIRWVS